MKQLSRKTAVMSSLERGINQGLVQTSCAACVPEAVAGVEILGEVGHLDV